MRKFIAAVAALLLTMPVAPSAAIVNGSQITGSDWGFLVALGCNGKSEKSFCRDRRYGATPDGLYTSQFCAGTLIAPRIVVTAAHCLSTVSGEQLNAEDLVVGGGTLNLQEMTDERVVGVREVIEHPSYNAGTQLNDLALLRLERTIPGSTSLPWNALDLSDETGLPSSIAGWGDLLPSGLSPRSAQLGRIELYGSDQCRQQLGTSYLAQSMLCGTARTTAGWVDSCTGDSGGPLIATVAGLRMLVGVISWGTTCASGKPGVYTNIARTLPAALSALAPSAPSLRAALRSISVTVDAEPWMSGAWAVLAERNLRIYTCGIVISPTVLTGSCTLGDLPVGGRYLIRVIPPIGVVAPDPTVIDVVKAAPDPPRIETVERQPSKRIAIIRFRMPEPTSAPTAVRTVTCTAGADTISARTSARQAVLTRVRPNTRYACRAQALNTYGTSATRTFVLN